MDLKRSSHQTNDVPRDRLHALIHRIGNESATAGRHQLAETEKPDPATDPPSGWRAAFERWWPERLRQSRVDPGRAGVFGVVLACVVALAVVLAALWWDEPEPAAAEAAMPPPIVPISLPPPEKLVVSVVGLVHRPGLVTLDSGARVADAVNAVGGPLPGADVLTLNLARRLSDGEQLYVAVPVPVGVVAPGGGQPGDGKVDLNTATVEQLDELPGVGPVTADRIVRWRTENGRFTSVDQLREVGGIGETRFSRLKDQVRI